MSWILTRLRMFRVTCAASSHPPATGKVSVLLLVTREISLRSDPYLSPYGRLDSLLVSGLQEVLVRFLVLCGFAMVSGTVYGISSHIWALDAIFPSEPLTRSLFTPPYIPPSAIPCILLRP